MVSLAYVRSVRIRYLRGNMPIIKAVQVSAKDLKSGDLFSMSGPDYWLPSRIVGSGGEVGEKVYIRTKAPAPKGQEDETVYRITIED